MEPRTLRIAAVAAATLTLAACGGGGGGSLTLTDSKRPAEEHAEGQGGGGSPTLTDSKLDRSDPRVIRLEGILERSDTLLIPGAHLRSSLSVQGNTVSERFVENVSYAGARCVGEDGTVTTVKDLIDPSVDIGLAEAEITVGSRDGFDTLTVRGGFEESNEMPGATITAAPTVNIYGFWGEHGFAAMQVADGSLNGQLQGISFTGHFSSAMGYATGDATGTNPAGIGNATWRGLAEAASTGTFELRQGTATITIADLSNPRVGVEIDVSGYAIDAPAWADMPLTDGRFVSGAAGNDYLEGNFHGPDHGETYGVFDTGAYIGVFGAKREQ